VAQGVNIMFETPIYVLQVVYTHKRCPDWYLIN
jgi:hypothetical protein